jgi:hypothetical protein
MVVLFSGPQRRLEKHAQEDHFLSRQRLRKNSKKQGGSKSKRITKLRSNLSLNRSVWRERNSRRKGRRRRKRRLKK